VTIETSIKVQLDMDDMAAEMEADGYFDSVDYALENLVGGRVVLERRSPEYRFSGVLMSTPDGGWEVVKPGIGGEVRGSHTFSVTRVSSVNGVIILLKDVAEETTDTDFCEACGENRTNYLIWQDDVSIRCDTCGSVYNTEHSAEELIIAKWDSILEDSDMPECWEHWYTGLRTMSNDGLVEVHEELGAIDTFGKVLLGVSVDRAVLREALGCLVNFWNAVEQTFSDVDWKTSNELILIEYQKFCA